VWLFPKMALLDNPMLSLSGDQTLGFRLATFLK
jgi:hypothetical protein